MHGETEINARRFLSGIVLLVLLAMLVVLARLAAPEPLRSSLYLFVGAVVLAAVISAWMTADIWKG